MAAEQPEHTGEYHAHTWRNRLRPSSCRKPNISAHTWIEQMKIEEESDFLVPVGIVLVSDQLGGGGDRRGVP